MSKKADKILRVGIASDTHFGSIYDQPNLFSDFVDICKKQNCVAILHAGDVIEGIGMRPEQEQEVRWHSFEEIVDGVIKTLPDAGIPYYFIGGNHDFWTKKNIGADVLHAVAKEREDVHYLGMHYANVDICGLSVGLFHGKGGCTAKRNTRLQNCAAYVVDLHTRRTDGVVPDLMVVGHCHSAAILPKYLGMMCLAAGGFQKQTPHMKEKGVIPDMSAYIISFIEAGDRMNRSEKIQSIHPLFFEVD